MQTRNQLMILGSLGALAVGFWLGRLGRNTPVPRASAAAVTESADQPSNAPRAPAPAEPVSAPAPVAAGTVDVVKVMQESLRAGQIKEFTFDQVQEWKAEADETVLGEAFQTGSVSYNMDSIFGTKTVQAKAYIKGGKVQRWIWAKTGKEIQ